MDADIRYADQIIAEAADGLVNAIAITFSLKQLGFDTDFGVANRQAELRQWRDYKRCS